jgi:hypothetical protein
VVASGKDQRPRVKHNSAIETGSTIYASISHFRPPILHGRHATIPWKKKWNATDKFGEVAIGSENAEDADKCATAATAATTQT